MGRMISSRVRCDYSYQEQNIMKAEKKVILAEIELKEAQNISVIYDNQNLCASLIVSHLHNRKYISIMIVALTQSGKTGVMVCLIKNYLNDTTNLIPIENIYIITGLSSIEWLSQTKGRLPRSIEARVFHRNNLRKDFVNDIKNKKNVLIICDEIQIAAKEDQTLRKSFNEAGFYDKQKLLENDIKIIEFSATPDGTIYDLMNWGDNSHLMKMEPGNGYTSCFNFIESNRVFQYKDLCCYNKDKDEVNEELVGENIGEIKEIVDNYESPMYHIFRTPTSTYSEIVITNFKNIFGEDMVYITYDMESEIIDLNNILSITPNEHTFIFIKEKLRCAKTLIKTHLGILYERYTTSPDDAVIVQGLIGRGTGYDDTGKTRFFTNINSIKKYKNLWDSNFNNKSVNWRSKTTKFNHKTLNSSGTYNNPALIDGMSDESIESNVDPVIIIKKFKTQDDIKQYYNNELKTKLGGNGPHKRKPNDNGFYETIIRSKKKICSFEDINKDKKYGLNNTNFRVCPCYENINDQSTLEFWIIHY